MQDFRPEDEISQWTKEDYLKGAAPYEWLYAMRNNNFMLLRMKALVEEAAKAVGIKNFAGLWNAYLETQKGDGGKSLLVNVTAFDGQPMELACGDYTCTDQGVTGVDG